MDVVHKLFVAVLCHNVRFLMLLQLSMVLLLMNQLVSGELDAPEEPEHGPLIHMGVVKYLP